MNGREISNILRKTYSIFLDVYASDELPTILARARPLVIVANLDPAPRPGSHWVSIYIDEQTGEYYDSLGQAPPTVF